MLHVGLDLSRKRLGYCLLAESGERVEVGVTPPTATAWPGSRTVSSAIMVPSRCARRSSR